jgi:hypothetical protein
VHQQVASVHQVECLIWKGVGEEIVLPDLYAWTRKRLEQTDIEVDRKHRARIAHTLGEESRRRTATGTRIETAPAHAHPDRIELTDRVWIANFREKTEPDPLELLSALLRKRVLGHGTRRYTARREAQRPRPPRGDQPVAATTDSALPVSSVKRVTTRWERAPQSSNLSINGVATKLSADRSTAALRSPSRPVPVLGPRSAEVDPASPLSTVRPSSGRYR